MGLNKGKSCRRITGNSIGPLHSQHLTLRSRCCHTAALAVTGTTHPFNDRINTIPIPHCIIHSLQNRYSDPFTKNNPVCIFMKRPGFPHATQGMGFTETGITKGMLGGINTTNNGQIRIPVHQLLTGHPNRCKG